VTADHTDRCASCGSERNGATWPTQVVTMSVRRKVELTWCPKHDERRTYVCAD